MATNNGECYMGPPTRLDNLVGVQDSSLNTPDNTQLSVDSEPLNMSMDRYMQNIDGLSYSAVEAAQNEASPASNLPTSYSQVADGASYDTNTVIPVTKAYAATSTDSTVKIEAKDPESAELEEPTAKAKERRRRQKLPDKQNMICKVCGDKANGFNFGAITCESCKAFFRRNALKTKEVECQFENNCKIDPFTRKFCTSCRLAKCLSIDMKKEWILDDDALKKRKRLIRKSKDTESPGTTSVDSTSVGSSGDAAKEDQNSPKLTLCEADEIEINEILNNHRLIDEDLRRGHIQQQQQQPAVAAAANGLPGDQFKQRDVNDRGYRAKTDEFNSLTDNPQDTIQLVQMVSGFIIKFIPFIKLLPAYDELKTMDHGLDDQVILIKQCIHEVMALRSAIQYNPNIDGFELEDSSTGEKKAMKMDFIRHMLGNELFEEHMKFVTSFNNAAKWDKPTMILTMVINLFASDRPGLHNKEHITRAEEHYSLLLQALLRSKYTLYEARSIYPKLLMKLTDVRTYGNLAKNTINNKNVNSSQLDPLLRELLIESGGSSE